MFKEALAGIAVLFLFYLFCRFLWKNNKRALSIVVVVSMGIAAAANIVYNAFHTFPHFYMDTVGGVFRYGTLEGNLFAYSDEFMFQDNILFPILRNRSVSLDASAGFYQKFFSLYAKDCGQAQISEQARQAVLSHRDDFAFSHEFSCIGIMDYVTDRIPAELAPSFDEERYTTVYINTDSLKDKAHLTVVMDTDYSLYVMSTDYYEQITGDHDNA